MAQAMQMSPADANMMARNMVLGQAINMRQSIASGTITTNIPGTVVNVPVRNVGMLKRFILEMTFTLAQSAAETFTLQPWGPANVCSQIIFTDLNNQNRINTAGWHLHALASARRQMAFGAAFTNDSPVAMKSNFPVIVAPASVTTVQTIRMFYELPIAYGDYDLRGSIFANVVNATMNIQFTVNPNLVVPTAATDATLAVYKSSTASLGTLGTLSWNVYQEYLDQLPQGKQGPIVPQLDLSTAYDIKNTAIVGGLQVGQETPIPYANFRNFMSTTVIFDNGGTLNVGSDVNYWALQSANYTNIFKIDPFVASLLTRNAIADDMPNGTYYFDHRAKPISTVQYGNMQLVVNPSVVNANASLLIGFEALALINQITQAGSLYAT